MATLFSDDFNRADTVSGLGAAWEVTRGTGGRIASNRVSWAPNNMHGARVAATAVAFPPNQWARMTVVGGGQTWMGIGVRMQPGPSIGGFEEQRGYFFWHNSSLRIIAWHRVGSPDEASLATVIGAQFAAGDVIELSAVDEYDGETFTGVRLRAYLNGVEILTALDTHAGAWRTGQPGYNNYTGNGALGFDNFEAGDFATEPSSVSAPLTMQWQVRQPASAATTMRWQVLAALASAIELRWQIGEHLAPVMAALRLDWQVRERLVTQLQTRWRIHRHIAAGAVLQWSVRRRLIDAVVLRWQVQAIQTFPTLTGTITIASRTPTIALSSRTPKITLH